MRGERVLLETFGMSFVRTHCVTVSLVLCLLGGAGFAQKPEARGKAPAAKAGAQKKRSHYARPGTPAVDFVAPPWKTMPSRSRMRLATYELPGKPAGSCIVYWFGPRGAGSVKDNIARWVRQIQSSEKPKVRVEKVTDGIRAHVVDARGKFVAAVRPGAKERHDQPGWRLLGVILETKGGPFYVKATGPAASIAAAEKDLMAWVKSFRERK